jgi:hypothetical protein
MDEIEVDVVELEAREAVLQRALRLLEAMAVVVALGRGEDLVAVDARGVDGLQSPTTTRRSQPQAAHRSPPRRTTCLGLTPRAPGAP